MDANFCYNIGDFTPLFYKRAMVDLVYSYRNYNYLQADILLWMKISHKLKS